MFALFLYINFAKMFLRFKQHFYPDIYMDDPFTQLLTSEDDFLAHDNYIMTMFTFQMVNILILAFF